MKKTLAAILAFILITVPAFPAFAGEDTIPEGVTVGGKDLSGADEKSASDILDGYLDEIRSSEISLTLDGDVKTTVTLEEAGIEVNKEELIKKAMEVGSSGNVLERYRELKEAEVKGLELTPEFTYDSEKLKSVVSERLEALNCEPEKAAIEIVDDKPVVKLSRDGVKVDTDATVKALEEELKDPAGADGISVPITAEITKAEDSDIDYSAIQDCLGTYTTVMGYYMENRVKNIINAAAKINGVVVKPGETFGLNGYLEPYTYDNGYVEATGYSNGRVVPAMGGGVCQLATTLYNAVLNAELEVNERHSHIMTVSYVPLSMDASIYEGSDNFKFTNNTDSPVYIYTYTSPDLKLTVAIFGKETRPSNRTIEFVSQTDATINPPADVVTVDPSKPAGYREVTQGAHVGYQASLYKRVYVDGQLTDTVHINNTRYGAYPRYVIAGPDPEPETEPPAPEEPDTEASAPEQDTEAPAPESPEPAEPDTAAAPPDAPAETPSGAEAVEGGTEGGSSE